MHLSICLFARALSVSPYCTTRAMPIRFSFFCFLRWTDDLEEIIHYRLFIYIKQGGKILNVQYDDFDNYVCPCNHHS